MDIYIYIYFPSLFPHAPNVKIKERRGSILSNTLFRSSCALPVKFSLFFFFFSENSSPHPRFLQTITHTRRCVVFPFFQLSILRSIIHLLPPSSFSLSFSRFSSAVCTLRGTTLARVTNPRFFRSFFLPEISSFWGVACTRAH